MNTRNSFGPNHRLCSKEDFHTIHQRSKRRNLSSLFVLSHKKSSPNPRIGISVKRSVGSAVARNRIKRLIREFFRTNKKTFSHQDVHFVVKVPQKGIKRAYYEKKLNEDFGNLVFHEKN